jgi:Zn-dependent peptidase ImmA (M78 family)/transcriptional regulator with XRE-family HTH domain
MSDNFTGMASRLKAARVASGLSTRDVASRLPDAHKVSHATIANYESGRFSPPMELLSAISDLYGKPVIWFLSSSPPLTGIRYRCRKSKLRKQDKDWYEANAAVVLEAYARLEADVKRPLKSKAPISAKPGESPAVLAARVRDQQKVPATEPIPSVVAILERYGVRVVELATDLPIDGMAATFGTGYAVVMNPNTSNDRCRMNAGHELFHVLYGDCENGATPDKVAEPRAFEAASNLIMPEPQLKEAFRGQSMVRLVQYKERFGISLAAMVYRAQNAGIITESTSKWLWIEFAKRGWRTNEPGRVRPDRATRFEELLDGAVAAGNRSWSDLVRLTCMREEELRERIQAALGILPDSDDHEEEGEDNPNVLKFPQ